jgi:hypothetical protein
MSEPHGKFCWYELVTTDTEAAGAFYRQVLGWNLQDSGHPSMSYTLLNVGDHGIGGMMQLPEEAGKAGARPGWMGYIWVREVEAAVDSVVAAGGKLHKAPDDIPGVGRFAVVSDPQGANFILFRHFGDQEAPPVAPGTPGYAGAGTSCMPAITTPPCLSIPHSLAGPRARPTIWAAQSASIRRSISTTSSPGG